MLKDIQQHLDHYLLLAVIILAGTLGILFFGRNETIFLGVLSLTGIAYVGWGIIHHRHEADVTFTLVLEYALTALLTIIFVAGVMQTV